MLGGRRGEGAADRAVQRAAGPEAARLVEEVRHLRRHPTEPGAGADDERIVVQQFVDRGDRRHGLLRIVIKWAGAGPVGR